MLDEAFEQPVPNEHAAQPDTRRTAPEVAESGPAAASEAPRRALKLVLSLQPATGSEAPGYRALLAVGAEGCDPLFRSVEVAGLPAALAEVPALVADAEARWQTQPHYPATTPPAAKAAAPRSRAGKSGRPALPSGATDQAATDQAAPAERESAAGAPPARPRSQPAPKPAPADQLLLFG